jgi:hypothetical protein
MRAQRRGRGMIEIDAFRDDPAPKDGVREMIAILATPTI